MVRVVQAALGGSEHAFGLHHEHIVEVPHQHGQQGQECQAVAKASEGAAHGKGQPVYQPGRQEKIGLSLRGVHELTGDRLMMGGIQSEGSGWVLVSTTDTSKDSQCLCTYHVAGMVPVTLGAMFNLI